METFLISIAPYNVLCHGAPNYLNVCRFVSVVLLQNVIFGTAEFGYHTLAGEAI